MMDIIVLKYAKSEELDNTKKHFYNENIFRFSYSTKIYIQKILQATGVDPP